MMKWQVRITGVNGDGFVKREGPSPIPKSLDKADEQSHLGLAVT